MSAAATMESVPTRETILEKFRANAARFVEMNTALGGLFTQSQAALLLGLGKARVGQLVEDGRLRLHEFTVDHADGTSELIGRYISGGDIERFVTEGRKSVGRPSKLRMAVAGLNNK